MQKKCKVFINHEGPVNNIEFSKDGKILISASSDKSLKGWKITDPNNFLKGKP